MERMIVQNKDLKKIKEEIKKKRKIREYVELIDDCIITYRNTHRFNK